MEDLASRYFATATVFADMNRTRRFWKDRCTVMNTRTVKCSFDNRDTSENSVDNNAHFDCNQSLNMANS